MPNLLITGASGYLAHRLLPIASTQAQVIAVARDTDAICLDVEKHSVDISDARAVTKLCDDVKPDAIIHAAASNPGGELASMYAVNHIGTANIAKSAARYGIRLVCVSTDVVHNGKAAPFADDAQADPLTGNDYGISKALGEQAIAASHANAVIVRTSLIYGTERMDRGTSGFAARLQSGMKLNLFSDVLRQPVWADSLADALCALALQQVNERGVINVAGAEILSRADFGIRLMDFWNIDRSSAVELISGVGIKGLPIDLRLKLDRAEALGFQIPGVSEVLARSY